MPEIDLSESVPALEMAEALYLGAGSAALAALTEKLDTVGHELTDAEREYVERVRYWLNSLLDEEARLEKLGALPQQ